MIQNRRAYQLIHCRTRSRLLAGAAAVCGAACGHADLGLYHLLHRGGAPLPDSTQADRAALAALCPKPAAEETCPLLPQQDPAVTLSVIVPVYNVQAYLSACVKSVVEQAGPADWECILVDDGSTDGSPALCDAIAAGDQRFVALHQPNSGVCAARTAGLRQGRALGARWFAFCDADDLYHPDLLDTLYCLLYTSDAADD